MAVLKCKMCGGDLTPVPGSTITVCEYCGTKQTLPSSDDEKKLTVFARAERLRRNNEFDKAAGIYEGLAVENPKDAECFWGLVLCKYGIEYVDDPATGRKVPTCHRSSYSPVTEDADYRQALACADAAARSVYEEQGAELEALRVRIAEVSRKEAPYDIFISYKDSDAAGQRTEDSAQAQIIYNALKAEGYRVFFSRITLEDKLGQDYEPIIFSALHTSRIMIVVGTQLENLEAVWVKNEWSRYLKMIDAGEQKSLIPCYLGLDPRYDLPKEFTERHLQAQDLGKIGALQDLVRAVKNLIAPEEQKKASAPAGVTATTDSLLLRAGMFLEEKDWNKANEYCERVLDADPENGRAWLGKLMAAANVSKKEELGELDADFNDNKNYLHAVKYLEEPARSELQQYAMAAKAVRDARLLREKKEAEEKARQEQLERERKEAEKKAEAERKARNLLMDKYTEAIKEDHPKAVLSILRQLPPDQKGVQDMLGTYLAEKISIYNEPDQDVKPCATAMNEAACKIYCNSLARELSNQYLDLDNLNRLNAWLTLVPGGAAPAGPLREELNRRFAARKKKEHAVRAAVSVIFLILGAVYVALTNRTMRLEYEDAEDVSFFRNTMGSFLYMLPLLGISIFVDDKSKLSGSYGPAFTTYSIVCLANVVITGVNIGIMMKTVPAALAAGGSVLLAYGLFWVVAFIIIMIFFK